MRALYIVEPYCNLKIHGCIDLDAPGRARWDFIDRRTISHHYTDETASRYLVEQFWVWPECDGKPEGDALVTYDAVTIRSGDKITSMRVSGLFGAMRAIGLDTSTFEVRPLPGKLARAA